MLDLPNRFVHAGNAVAWGVMGSGPPLVLVHGTHDFGGATVLRAYYLNGLRYKRLTLIDPVAVAPWGSPFVAHVRQYEAAFAGLPAYAHDALLRAYLQTAAHATLSDEAFRLYITPKIHR